MRMILDCEPDIAVLAMRAIKSAMKRPDNLVQIVGFEDGSTFLVRKTKTGWSAKADKALEAVTAEIIDQPVTPKFPLTKSGEPPVSMREFIGLTGREYLTAYVNSTGQPTTDRRYGQPRIQYLITQYMGRKFKDEIEKATRAVIAEIGAEIRAKHEAFLAAEKKRLAEALSKLTA